jgi:hypothetical protein
MFCTQNGREDKKRFEIWRKWRKVQRRGVHMISLIRVVIGGLIGAAIGFTMYKVVGCRTGACPLTGNPFVAIFLWGLMGALLGAAKI